MNWSNFLPAFLDVFSNLGGEDIADLLLVATVGHIALNHLLTATTIVGMVEHVGRTNHTHIL